MNALIVVESWFGNAHSIAEHLTHGLGDLDVQASVVAVEDAPDVVDASYDLLIIGAPTHGGGLSTPQSRQDVAESGGPQGTTGAQEWIDRVEIADGVKVAAFTTLLDDSNPDETAANAIAKDLSERYTGKVIEIKTFLVEESKGPLAYGEIESAHAWGQALAESLQ